jgi:hypothetical protein
MRAVATSMLAISGLVAIALDPVLRNSLGTIWLVAAASAIFAFLVHGPVTVTADGLSRTRVLRPDIFVSWDQLDHYEVCKRVLGIWGASNVYYFRTRDGRTMKVNEWPQDLNVLLSEISHYKKLPELPFHNR